MISGTPVPGANLTATQRWLSGGNPLVVAAPITTSVTVGNRVVSNGVAVQSATDPALWTYTFALPSTAPAGDYELLWSAATVGGTVQRSESFTVAAPQTNSTEAVAVYSGTAVSDTLVLPSQADGDIVQRLIDPNGNAVLSSVAASSGTAVPGGVAYTYTGPVLDAATSPDGILPYQLHWIYSVGGAQTVRTRPVFLFDYKVIAEIDALQRYLDKSLNRAVAAGPLFTSIELAHFLMVGLQRINGTSPVSGYRIRTLPEPLTYAWKVAAQSEALNALYLDEGFRSFNFTGQATQLDVDYTQYISTKMEEQESWLNDNLPRLKKETKRKASVGGVLGISYSPNLNIPAGGAANNLDSLLLGASRFSGIFGG